MDFKTYFGGLTAQQKKDLASKLDANLVYLFQIAGGSRRPSPELAQKIAASTPLKLTELRPDIWKPTKKAA